MKSSQSMQSKLSDCFLTTWSSLFARSAGSLIRAPGGAAGPKQLGLTLEIDSSCRRLFPCGCAVGRRGPNDGVWIQSGMCGASPRTMARGEATATRDEHASDVRFGLARCARFRPCEISQQASLITSTHHIHSSMSRKLSLIGSSSQFACSVQAQRGTQ